MPVFCKYFVQVYRLRFMVYSLLVPAQCRPVGPLHYTQLEWWNQLASSFLKNDVFRFDLIWSQDRWWTSSWPSFVTSMVDPCILPSLSLSDEIYEINWPTSSFVKNDFSRFDQIWSQDRWGRSSWPSTDILELGKSLHRSPWNQVSERLTASKVAWLTLNQNRKERFKGLNQPAEPAESLEPLNKLEEIASYCHSALVKLQLQ